MNKVLSRWASVGMALAHFVFPSGSVAAGPRAAKVSVVNRGVPGQNSSEGRERFLLDVVEAHPQYVLIYFGMNDAVNEPKFLTEGQFIQNVRWMVDRAREDHIVPIVSTIQHVDVERVMERHKASSYGVEGPNRKIDRYNAALRRLCVEQKISLADFSKVLDDAGGPSPVISTDGVHLTAEGYRLLAATFFQAIAGLPEEGDSIVCIGDSLTYGVPLRTPDRNSDQTYPAQLERMLLRLRLAESRE